MEILQTIDLSRLGEFVPIVLCLLCVVGLLLGFLLQFLGIAFDVIGGILDVVFQVISGGPIAWCGCLLLIGGCGICGVFMYGVYGALQTCGTPEALNICRIFGS